MRPKAVQPIDQVLRALRTIRLTDYGVEERVIHERIDHALMEAGIAFEHEKALGARARVDFLTLQGVAIEVKKRRPACAGVTAQITRYARHKDVRALVLVLERHIDLPPHIEDKPVRVLSLNSLWGIAV